MTNPRALHSQLKDVTRRYGHAVERYERGMRQGDLKTADQALSDMQEIEQSVTLIVQPQRAKR